MERFFLYENYPAFIDKKNVIIFDYNKNRFIELPQGLLSKKTASQHLDLNFTPRDKEFNPQRPQLTLILNRNCNMRCRYCSVYGGKYRAEMSLETAIGAVRHIISNNPKEVLIVFFGGEPTLSMKIIKSVVNYLNKNYKGHLLLAISTNGIISEETADYLIKNNFIINFSADGVSEVQNFQRPLVSNKPSSKIVEKTIRKFKSGKTLFKVRATITNHSVKKMTESLKYFINLGAEVVHFEPLNMCGRTSRLEFSRPNHQEYIKNYKKCAEIAKENNIRFVSGLYNNLLEPSYDYCEAVSGAKIVITPEGYITRCYEVQDRSSPHFKDFIVGKTNDAGFEIDSAKLKKLKRKLDKKRAKCRKCFARFICSGGCPLRDDSYRCKVNKELIADAIIRSWEATKPLKVK